jgi:hypothetical protein
MTTDGAYTTIRTIVQRARTGHVGDFLTDEVWSPRSEVLGATILSPRWGFVGSPRFSRGLRRGLHSCAASRLVPDRWASPARVAFSGSASKQKRVQCLSDRL